MQEGRHADGIDALRAGIELTDSWLLCLYIGIASAISNHKKMGRVSGPFYFCGQNATTST